LVFLLRCLCFRHWKAKFEHQSSFLSFLSLFVWNRQVVNIKEIIRTSSQSYKNSFGCLRRRFIRTSILSSHDENVIGQNELDCLCLTIFILALNLWVMSEVCQLCRHKVLPWLALVAKITLASKDLPVTNTLAYLAPPTIRKIPEKSINSK